MKLEVHDLPAKPVRAPKEFTLVLNDEEAATLHAIFGRAAGPDDGPRRLTDAIYYALRQHIDMTLREKISRGITFQHGNLFLGHSVES